MLCKLSRQYRAANSAIYLYRFCSNNVNKATGIAVTNKTLSPQFPTQSSSVNLPELTVQKQTETDPQEFISRIKSSTDSLQVLSHLSCADNKPLISTDAIMTAFNQIFLFQKSQTDTVQSSDLIQNPNFETLCRKLKRFGPSMDVSEIIQSLKIISYLGIPANSEISIILLQLINEQMNRLSLREITFLNYLLAQMQPTVGFHRALKAALPTLFNIQFNKQADTDNVPEMIALLQFMVDCEDFKFGKNKYERLFEGLRKHRKTIDWYQNKRLLRYILLLDTQRIDPKLLKFCLNIFWFDKDKVNYTNMFWVLHKLVERSSQSTIFFHLRFFKTCVRKIIDEDMGLIRACAVQQQFKLISNVNTELLTYIYRNLINNFEEIPTLQAEPLFTIVQAFASASFNPLEWTTAILPKILQNENLLQMPTLHTTWLQFTLQLIVFGHFDRRLIELVLSESFLEFYLKQHSANTTDHLKLLILYQNVVSNNERYPTEPFIITGQKIIESILASYLSKQTRFPFRSFLEFQLGEGCVLTRVKTKYGHFMQHLVKMNCDTGEFVPFQKYKTSEEEVTEFEDIECNAREKLICIDGLQPHMYANNGRILKGVYTLRKPLLEQMGIGVVEINLLRWNKLADIEKIPHIIRQIKECIN